ncbi:hypothetical protein IW261DRAFT_736667 [Armillaria novae-zelandiae]|uniref:Uncharacterized protein n=1 Tax=Armillaria novae-zelandiae TaxID=153914 RepID=A0AA39NVH3_9AGAR|nr:hypothetical protein IW261DRAFT_736667 [Armillaria novae-zelandiae]
MQTPPAGISQDELRIIHEVLDTNLNKLILQALLHGLYTGILAVTLWTMFSSAKHLRSKFLGAIIIALYILSTIGLGSSWAFKRRAFIQNGDNYYSVYTVIVGDSKWYRLDFFVGGITGGLSTFLVDIAIIWRCWTLWEYQWRVVAIPILAAVAGTVMKAMQILSAVLHIIPNILGSTPFEADIDWSLIYALLTLATTLMCALLIIYRIVRHARRMSASRKIVEMLIESCAIYLICLIIYLALVSKNAEFSYYADVIASYVRAIAPTLLVGRVSAHANSVLRRQKMVAMWENHTPLVGCFREEDTNNDRVYHSPDVGHQMLSGSSGKETV